MSEATKKDAKYIYMREGFVRSVVADIITFGGWILLMFLNFNYWGGHWYVTIFLLIVWLLGTIGRASNRVKYFYTAEDVLKYLEAEKEAQKVQYE